MRKQKSHKLHVPLRKAYGVLFILLFALIGATLLHLSFAAKPSVQLYLSPATATVDEGTAFTMDVRLSNPSGTSIDYVKASLTFPANVLTLTATTTTESNFIISDAQTI